MTFFPANGGPTEEIVDTEAPPLIDQSMEVSRSFEEQASTRSSLDLPVLSAHARNIFLLPDDDQQLRLPWHVAMTFKLWLVVTALAIAAPSLGDVLDLVGCATGTMIAFIVPAALSFRLQGYNRTAALLLVIGILVGVVGTVYSSKQLLADIVADIE